MGLGHNRSWNGKRSDKTYVNTVEGERVQNTLKLLRTAASTGHPKMGHRASGIYTSSRQWLKYTSSS